MAVKLEVFKTERSDMESLQWQGYSIELHENSVYKILVELVNRNFQLINVVPENLFLPNPKN
jgi:hypothetical protein